MISKKIIAKRAELEMAECILDDIQWRFSMVEDMRKSLEGRIEESYGKLTPTPKQSRLRLMQSRIILTGLSSILNQLKRQPPDYSGGYRVGLYLIKRKGERAMKKELQIKINSEVRNAYENMLKEYLRQEPLTGYHSWKQLRSCSADVLTIDNYFILRSYNTIIACIDRQTGILYDFLRMVYGYTSTSVQHIAKFSADYGWGKFRSLNTELRYYDV